MSVHKEDFPLGWWTKARVIRWVDGDTLDVRIMRTFRVRLLGCNAPELHSKNELGKMARDYMKEQIPEGSDVIIHVPDSHGNLSTLISFSRILANAYIDGVSACDILNNFLEKRQKGAEDEGTK